MTSRWFHISIFCSKAQWHKILFEIIRPYLGREIKDGNVLNYKIHLNNERGDNLRISAQVVDFYNSTFLDQFADIVSAHFAEHTLLTTYTPHHFNNKFLLDFPPNSIFYKLYQLPQIQIDDTIDNCIHGLETVFSNVIIEALKEEEFDDETISTFYIYACFIVLFEFQWMWPLFVTQFRSFQQNLVVNRTEGKVDEMQRIFSAAREDLLSIAEECFSKNENSTQINWMLTWRQGCGYFISTIIDIDLTRAEYLLDRVIKRMASQLNLEEKVDSLTWTICEAYKLFMGDFNKNKEYCI